MECTKHPGREAVAICEKSRIGFCRECCECAPEEECCACRDPALYCTFRTQCMIWELARQRKRRTGA